VGGEEEGGTGEGVGEEGEGGEVEGVRREREGTEESQSLKPGGREQPDLRLEIRWRPWPCVYAWSLWCDVACHVPCRPCVHAKTAGETFPFRKEDRASM
jgi:hypothetical protein